MNNNTSIIEELEIEINAHPNNINSLCKLADLYFQDGRGSKAIPLVQRAIDQFLRTQLTVTQGLNVLDVGIRAWKSERYSQKKTMRVNVSRERKQLLDSVHQVALALVQMRDPKQGQVISYKTAYVKECIGSLEDSLSLLSDLISSQAVEGVDFAYIIWKAAVVLKHIGQNKQSIEYLEYLDDEPPVDSGYSRVHILAFLILVYEQSAEKYRVFLGATYKKLLQACAQDVEQSHSRQARKLYEIVQNKNVHQMSELWEVLAIQALDRCEYILAIEFLNQASTKAPGKGSILQWMVEAYFLLGDTTKASKYGEKALVLLPQSTELRNILIQINPDVWTEKLRFISPTKTRETLSPNRKTRAGAGGENEFSFASINNSRSITSTAMGALNLLKPTSSSSPTPVNDSANATTNTLKSINPLPVESKETKDTAVSKDTKENPTPASTSSNWFTKMANSASSALQSIAKDSRSLSPPRDRKENGGSPTLNVIEDPNTANSPSKDSNPIDAPNNSEKYKQPIPDSLQTDQLEEHLVKVLDQQIGAIPAESRSPSRKGKKGTVTIDPSSPQPSPHRLTKASKSNLANQSQRIQLLEEEMRNSQVSFVSSVSGGSTKSLKPKKVTAEHKKFINLALFGNQNVHFYHPTLQTLSSIPKKIEIDKRRQELMK